ncbi:MAG: type II secretion system protein [Planctomycetota bacterium]|nr:MAG: type II secretion system protein [Planctomycetota bacterium]
MSQIPAIARSTLAGDARQRGFTLVEVMVALVVLAISALAMQLALGVTTRLNGQNARLSLARTAVADKIEELAALEPVEIVATYGSPGGVGFNVPTFTPPPQTQQVGLIEVLTEAQASAELGTPLDLDGDGIYSETEPPHAGFTAAFVRVSVQWTNDGSDSNVVRSAELILPSL